MGLELPTSLSPSKVSTFTECALAFRFSAIDRLPEAPSPAAVKGTLVHAALERLFCRPAPERTVDAALEALDEAAAELRTDPEFVGLGLDDDAEATFHSEATELVHRYFRLEDPTAIHPIGIELRLEAQVGDLTLRGIIDRLELDDDGGLVVTDYKTGRAPNPRNERARLGGVHFYAFLCEQLFDRRPSRVQLLYLSDPIAIVAEPTSQSSRGLERKVGAIWQAVERACEHEDFRPKPSALCEWCSFRSWCPAFGGNPDDARRELLAPAG